MNAEQIAAIKDRYTPVRTWEATGAWVAATTCNRCGATLLLDPDNPHDVYALHEAFHVRLDPR